MLDEGLESIRIIVIDFPIVKISLEQQKVVVSAQMVNS